MSERLDALIGELEAIAGRLRAGDLEASEAAELVERCAELATSVGEQLHRESRSAQSEALFGNEPPGQEELL